MTNLKDLKTRIDSVKSTQKITSAMRMVAAAKLKRSQERAQSSRSYADSMKRMLTALSSSYDDSSSAQGPKMLTGSGADKTHLIVLLTSDRGLCGAFNSSLIKKAKEHISSLKREGKEVKIIALGRKGQVFFKRSMPAAFQSIDFEWSANADFYLAKNLSEHLVRLFENSEFDVCSLLYNNFKSALTQIPTLSQLIPFQANQTQNEENEILAKSNNLYDFEPNEETVLSELLPSNLAVQIYQGLLENNASEHGARMTAMDNATRNAGDMINKLTLTYNRTRQALITKELIEIISGTEAL